MPDILFWAVFGALAGWITSLMLSSGEGQSTTRAHMVAGITGALIGGVLARRLSGLGDPDAASLITAVFGALALIGTLKLFVGSKRNYN